MEHISNHSSWAEGPIQRPSLGLKSMECFQPETSDHWYKHIRNVTKQQLEHQMRLDTNILSKKALKLIAIMDILY